MRGARYILALMLALMALKLYQRAERLLVQPPGRNALI